MSTRISIVVALVIVLGAVGTCARAQDTGQSIRQDADQSGYDLLRHFGVGLSLTHDLGKDERIDDAQIVNGLVRVNRDSNNRARVMLEWHSWMLCEHLLPGEADPAHNVLLVEPRHGKPYLKQEPPCDPARRSSGAFVAVQPGSDSVIDAIGLGWMFRFPDKLHFLGERALNVGLGLVVDEHVQVLGHGFVADAPPPTGALNTPELQVRYRNTAQGGIFAMASIELGQAPVTLPHRTLSFYFANTTGKPDLVVGDTITLFWNVEEMDSCEASDAWTGPKTIQGQEQRQLPTEGSQKFTLTCKKGNARSATKFFNVVVKKPAPAQPTQ